jgi:hypothetical protein
VSRGLGVTIEEDPDKILTVKKYEFPEMEEAQQEI